MDLSRLLVRGTSALQPSSAIVLLLPTEAFYRSLERLNLLKRSGQQCPRRLISHGVEQWARFARDGE